MKRILVMGATSAIAEATARLWAQRGDALFLVARNPAKNEAIAQDLRVRGAAAVSTYTMDACDLEEHSPMIDQCYAQLGGLDIALIAHGTLSDQKRCELSVPDMMREFESNALSVMALCTHLANRLEAQGSGTLAVISSVAGDRGRASNYVYGSAKAAVSAFLSGLRQRLWSKGVTVITIKPGFVDTPMTSHLPKGPLWASAHDLARHLYRAINANKSTVTYAPAFWAFIMRIICGIPESVFVRLSL